MSKTGGGRNARAESLLSRHAGEKNAWVSSLQGFVGFSGKGPLKDSWRYKKKITGRKSRATIQDIQEGEVTR